MRPAHTYMKKRHAIGQAALAALAVGGVLFAASVGCLLAGDMPALLLAVAVTCCAYGAWETR